jgi:tripartite-type tricarboxylate transporter receptor subunit TctC
MQVVFGPISKSIEYIRTGKLRALAVATVMRQAALPDILTIAEFVPGYEARGWYEIGPPANRPIEIIDKLNATINRCLADPNLKPRSPDLGAEPMPMTIA